MRGREETVEQQGEKDGQKEHSHNRLVSSVPRDSKHFWIASSGGSRISERVVLKILLCTCHVNVLKTGTYPFQHIICLFRFRFRFRKLMYSGEAFS